MRFTYIYSWYFVTKKNNFSESDSMLCLPSICAEMCTTYESDTWSKYQNICFPPISSFWSCQLSQKFFICNHALLLVWQKNTLFEISSIPMQPRRSSSLKFLQHHQVNWRNSRVILFLMNFWILLWAYLQVVPFCSPISELFSFLLPCKFTL